MTWTVPLSDIDITKEEIDAVTDVVSSRWLTMGPRTKEFEEEFANYLGAEHVFLVSNGTAALHLALIALGVKNGDEAIVPSMTFVATANSILYTGAKPVFADIVDVDEPNISPDDINKKITSRTKAILAVHYAGYPSKMDVLREIAVERDIAIVEDAAHAPGAEYGEKKAGTIGNIGCFSFFSNKNLVTGEGGLIVTDDIDLAEKIKLIRSHGMTTLTWDRERGHAHSYDVVALGYNYRSNEVAAALGKEQLKKLDSNNEKRRGIAERYASALKELPQITIPFLNWSDGKSSHHIFPIVLPENVDRYDFIERLKSRGVQTSIHYPPIHKFSHYRELFGEINLPVTEMYGMREVTLPLFPTMTQEQIELVIEEVKNFFL